MFFLRSTTASCFAVLLSVAPAFTADVASIGRQIFLDTSLSQPVGQGCVSCHQIDSGFADFREVSLGAVKGKQGTRNSQTLMYAALGPPLVYETFYTNDGEQISAWKGGRFHDGRARDLYAQVQQPFFNPLEMNLPGPEALAGAIRESEYANELRQWMGAADWVDDDKLLDHVYQALVEFLREPLFRAFDARIDDFLAGDESVLNESEMRGFSLFTGAGMCADCHSLTPDSWDEPLLSDSRYYNLGLPSRGEKDPGLGAHTKSFEELGQFRVPTLRNIELTGPYMHNGSIDSLTEVIQFYNTRDTEPDRWGPTDYPDTVNHEKLGNLGLSEQDVADLVALMSAFTDRILLERDPGGPWPEAPEGGSSTEEVRDLFLELESRAAE